MTYYYIITHTYKCSRGLTKGGAALGDPCPRVGHAQLLSKSRQRRGAGAR